MLIKSCLCFFALLMVWLANAQENIPSAAQNAEVQKSGKDPSTRKWGFANPWQQASGEILLSPFVSYYRATSFRDNNGDKSDFSNDGTYSDYNPRLYFSLPLVSDQLNVFGSIPYFINKYEDDNLENTNTDFGDIELGLRLNLAHFGDNYLMAAVIGYIPAYSNDQLPFAGYKRFGLEPRLLLGGTLKFLGDYNNFHKVELGFRYYFPDLDPVQIRFLISEGYRVTERFIVQGELEGLFSISDDDQFFKDNLQLVAEYQMIKASLNLGFEFTKSFALYGGVFHDIFNRNSGIGSGLQTFAVIKID